MEKKAYISYEELPLMLTVPDVASVLGVSRAGAYELAHSEGFLVLNVGSRIVIPRDNCTFDAKKMIIDQFVKAVYVKRGFELDIEFNVSFDEFQTLSLGSEAGDIGKAPVVLAYTEEAGQAI